MFENSMVVQEFIFWMKMDIFIRAIANYKEETIGAARVIKNISNALVGP